MKNVMIAGAALLGTLSLASAAFAQGYPVGDGYTEVNTQAIARTTAKIEGDTTAIQTNTKTTATNTGSTATNTLDAYKMFTAPHDVTSIFTKNDGDTVQNVMPDTGVTADSATSVANIATEVSFKSPMLTAAGKTFYDQNNTVSTGTDDSSNPTDPVLIAQDAAQKVSSNIQGLAAANLNALKQRLSDLDEMSGALTNAKSITEVETINGRIAVETIAVQAEQAQAANLVAIATAQAEINRENEAQAMRQEHKKTAGMFSSALTGAAACAASQLCQ